MKNVLGIGFPPEAVDLSQDVKDVICVCMLEGRVRMRFNFCNDEQLRLFVDLLVRELREACAVKHPVLQFFDDKTLIVDPKLNNYLIDDE